MPCLHGFPHEQGGQLAAPVPQLQPLRTGAAIGPQRNHSGNVAVCCDEHNAVDGAAVLLATVRPIDIAQALSLLAAQPADSLQPIPQIAGRQLPRAGPVGPVICQGNQVSPVVKLASKTRASFPSD